MIGSPESRIGLGEALSAPRHHPRNVVQVDPLVEVFGPLAHPGRFDNYVVRQLALDANGDLVVRSRPPVVIEERDVGACGRVYPRFRWDGQGLLHSREGPSVSIHTDAEAVGRIGSGAT